MAEFDRCTRCVLSAAFPRIKFDENGVCSFCNNKMIATSEAEAIADARKQVDELLAGIKGKHSYDAILCNSGGKDSSYTLMTAVRKYGMRVLSFTLDNGFISPAASKNIHRVVDSLGVDHITVRPAKTFYSQVIKASALLPIYNAKTLTRISAGCNSCISLVNITALRFALEKDIPLILAGFTLGQIPANGIIYKNHYKFLEESRKTSMDKLRSAVGNDVDSYYGISDDTLESVKSYPHNVNLLCLEEITEDDIVKEVSKLGWTRPGDVDGCSSNCQLNTFNNFVHEQQLGYNPYELELSHLIRKGLMTRDEALEKMADQPLGQLRSIAKRLNMTDDEAATLGLTEAIAKH